MNSLSFNINEVCHELMKYYRKKKSTIVLSEEIIMSIYSPISRTLTSIFKYCYFVFRWIQLPAKETFPH